MVDKETGLFATEKILMGTTTVVFMACEHNGYNQNSGLPKEIDDEIKNSSLVFVEYFPPELARKVYSVPGIGNMAKFLADEAVNGVNPFFNKILETAATYKKSVAVADIANGLEYMAYHGLLRSIPGGATLLLGYENIIFREVGLGLLWGGMLTNLQEALRTGVYGKNRSWWEKFVVDMEDARRLITARGIEQEALKRPGAQIALVSPRAHVDRIKWYLKNPNDSVSKAKEKIYSLFVGLDKSTRIYKPTSTGDWQQISNIPVFN